MKLWLGPRIVSENDMGGALITRAPEGPGLPPIAPAVSGVERPHSEQRLLGHLLHHHARYHARMNDPDAMACHIDPERHGLEQAPLAR